MLRRMVPSDLFPRGTPSFIHRGLLRGHWGHPEALCLQTCPRQLSARRGVPSGTRVQGTKVGGSPEAPGTPSP